MDLRWLSAPAHEVAAAMAAVRRDSRPAWVPTKRQLLVHINRCLILWFLFVAFMVIGIRVNSYQGGRVTAADIGDLALTAVVLAIWLYGTYWLHRWAAMPPSPRARMKEWRQTLTALANGYESAPSPRSTFTSLLSAGHPNIREYPRFVASEVEFGNLVRRSTKTSEWRYLAVTLPAPLPHLILDATANNRIGSDLPIGIERGQHISLEGDFDRWFQTYSPVTYRTEALYVLSPDVMAALIDHAAGFNVEIVDTTLVFYSSPGAELSEPEHWIAVDAILSNVIPRIVAKAEHYLDERVPGQEVPRVISAIRAQLENPATRWVPPTPRIGADGRRLATRGLGQRNRNSAAGAILGGIGWFAFLTLLYAVPGIFAFAGFMSIVDGR